MLEERNIKREEIIFKIYLTKSDVRNFLCCGWVKANKKFDECYQKCIDDEHTNVEGRIYYKYLLDLLGISESEIHRLAKIERQIKKDA